jgi:F0F1-type ATP synthase assembly protein I
VDLLRERRELNNGFGNALSRAFELATIPLIFAAPGWLVDRWLGTGPVFALLTGLFGLAGVVVRTYYEYVGKMDREHANLPGAARRQQGVAG